MFFSIDKSGDLRKHKSWLFLVYFAASYFVVLKWNNPRGVGYQVLVNNFSCVRSLAT